MTYAELARRGNAAWWTWPIVALAGVLIGIIAAGLFIRIAWPDGAAALLQGAGSVRGLAASGLVFGIVLAVFAGIAFAVQRKRPGDIIGAWSWRKVGIGIAFWGAVSVLSAAVDFAVRPHGFHRTAGPESMTLAMVALPALAVQTFAEEFVFRGWLTQGMLLWLKRPLPAAIAAGVLFAAAHYSNSPSSAVAAAALGVVFSLIAMRTGGIALTFGMHLINNYFGSAIIVSQDDVFQGLPALVTQSTPDLVWWDVWVEVAALVFTAWFFLRSGVSRAVVPAETG